MGILRRGFMLGEFGYGHGPEYPADTDPNYDGPDPNGPDHDNGHKLSAGAIAGIAVAGAVVLILLLLLCCCCCLKWKKRRSSKKEGYAAEKKHGRSKKLPFFLKWMKKKKNREIPVTENRDIPVSVAKEVEVVSTDRGGSSSKTVEVESEEIMRAAAVKYHQSPPVVGIKAPPSNPEPEVLVYVDHQPAPQVEQSDSEDNPHVTIHPGIVARPSTSPDVFKG